MSVHKPFTRGGRHLVLVRPRPFVPPPLPAQVWRMVRRPSAGVALVLRSRPDLARLAAWLLAAGLIEAVAASFFGRAEAHNSYFSLRTMAEFPTAWGVATLLLYAAGRLLGDGEAGALLRPTFQITGVAMCAGPLLAAMLLPVPLLARLLFCAWLAAVCYQTGRQAYGLGGWRAAATALPAPVALAGLWLTMRV